MESGKVLHEQAGMGLRNGTLCGRRRRGNGRPGERWWPPLSADALAVLLAVTVGAGTGAGIILFRKLIALAQSFFFGAVARGMAAHLPWSWADRAALVLPPVLGGLVVGTIVLLSGRRRRPSPGSTVGSPAARPVEIPPGVAGIIEATALAGGRLPYTRAPGRALAAALSIGSGASVGPEDPSVQIGANLGSALGQKLGLGDEYVRLLVAAGAASGIAAAFNAPIAGVFFALEVILGEFTTSAFSVVVLAAVLSSVVAQSVLGAQPAFLVPPYELRSPWELPLYVGLGMLAAVVATIYARSIDAAERWGSARPGGRLGAVGLAMPLRTAAGGLVIGLVAGLGFPELFGVGYETIGRLLAGEAHSVGLLAALLILKIGLTAWSLGVGFVGGVFAPSLFVGAMLGGLYGHLLNLLLPGTVAIPAAYAMVGMAAVLAATIRAPFTATLILFEMTRDYRIILPLLGAVGAAVLLGDRLLAASVYHLALRRHGVHLVRGQDIDVMQGIMVGEVMSQDYVSFGRHTPLAEALHTLETTHHHAGLVFDEEGKLYGILSLGDIERALASDRNEGEGVGDARPATVGSVCSRDVVTVFPDETMWVALQRMGWRDIGRLPVVARDDPGRVLGIIRRSDIIHAYNLAIIRRTSYQQRAEAVRLGLATGTDVLEIRLPRHSPAAGKRLAELHLPPECVIASVRRGRQVIVPSGSTVLAGDDVLVAVCDPQVSGRLRSCLLGNEQR